MTSLPRLLVFIPSYQADRHIEWVIDRIPRDLGEDFDTEIVVFDDASHDQTVAVAQRAFERSDLPYDCRVLSNPRNQGYGGNQKLGYQYGVNAGFDVVVMVHGDGQYPPEEIAAIAHCALEHGAAFGSRFATERGALDGGMPRYKFVGNKILTRVQNALLTTELTEFHSGFRAYRRDVLETIPFSLNSNDFHFDTEIFIQVIRAGFDIGEIPIRTHYGDEECRVDGMAYAGNVVSQSLRSRLHDMGLFYERKYDVESRDGIYESKVDFDSPAAMAYSRISPKSTVLDLGSADGFLAGELARKQCRVIGVDLVDPEDPTVFERFIRHNLDTGLPEIEEEIDVVVLLDVVEHLRAPEDFVEELAEFCRRKRVQRILVSTGNVAFAAQRLMLLLGQFNYGPRGILDMTHTRLFTMRTIGRLFRQAGFRVTSTEGVPAPFPLAIGRGRKADIALALNGAAIRLFPRIFSFQFFLELTRPADLDELIRMSHVYAASVIDVTTPEVEGRRADARSRP